MKVLIIDDEENIRFLLCNFLKKFESELQIVGTCDNGEEGLELCKKLSPDLIISDIRMPNMSGLELLRKVRETNKNCFCIFVSAYTEFSYVHEAIKNGAVDYILKPIQEEELYKIIRKVIGEWKKNRNEKEKVKLWYDGFTFGESRDIYNPWSIINFLDEKKYKTYWADSSSNGLVNELIRTGSAEIKKTMETLMAGGIVEKNIDEQIVFEQLKTNKDAVWSLLLASGYLRVEAFRTEGRLNKKIYSLKLTNYEVEQMFGTMIERWFGGADVPYNEFINAMLNGDIESMNEYMNRVTRGVISYFDTGKTPSDEEPERFYHGLVLGLMVDQVDNYILNSNRESGYGRYDIMLEPIDKTNEKYPGIVIEFKVINPRKENSLEETVASALEQIEEKNYDAELIKRGVKEENIHHYGFAFKGKEVLIDGR